jgi:hypothetical protein
VSVGTERGWVGRIPVPQTGFPCGTKLVSVVSVGTLVSIVSVVSVLKKPTRVSPYGRPTLDGRGQAPHLQLI